MKIRLTQRLSSKIKAGRLAESPLDENPYADWSARLFTADRAQYILLSNTASLYSVVMFGRGITSDDLFIKRTLDTIREFMTDDGLGLIYMNFIAPAGASVRCCKAPNRSVTGSMNELEKIARLYLETGECSPFEVGFKLNETLLSAVAGQANGYATPREAIRQIKPESIDATPSSTASRSNDMPAKKRKKSSRKATPKKKKQRACGLCGATKNLTRTECCGNWICDDEQDYVMFSYARNSCHRNHRRYTLCAFHHDEGHEGRWQDCAECRDAIETEMYVYYGTNEYNFERLPDPPSYEPTRCARCGRIISLGEDGHSIAGGEYFCYRCGGLADSGELMSLDEGELDMAEDAPAAPGGSHQANSPQSRRVGLEELKSEVPEAYRERFDAIVERTDAFCAEHLTDDYKQLSREMAAAVCQEGSPARKGKPESWAAGVVYALGRVNFLSDPSQDPHLKSDQIAKGIGVSPATMQAKARVIREGLDLIPLHPDWSLPGHLKDNPLVWLMEVNGLVMDIRMAPREVQAAAYEQGIIPYIPADAKES